MIRTGKGAKRQVKDYFLSKRAISTHYDVGEEVRHAIEKIHQKNPEDLPRAASIHKLVEEKRRKTRKRLKNAPPDEQGTLF